MAFTLLGAAAAAGAAGTALVTVAVVKCPTEFAVEGVVAPTPPPRVLAHVSARDAKQLRYYSNGLLGVLAPKGWKCSAIEAADGGEGLEAHPAGQPDAFTGTPPATAQEVAVTRDYTGHGPGAQQVCTLFPDTPAGRLAADLGCPKRAAGEVVSYPVPTVARFRDPPHVKGSGALSGGDFAAVGAQVYPFTRDSAGGVGVFVHDVSCTLRRSTLCPTIVDDFVLRAAPEIELPSAATRG